MDRKVLIIDDEKPIVEILGFNLKKEGYQTVEAFDGEQGLALALTEQPDLILLDIMLPKMDGFTVCRKIREHQASTPILMLTAKEEEVDKVLGLELGADDYITKPFSVRELMARVKANLRRNVEIPAVISDNSGAGASSNANVLVYDRLHLDFTRYEVKKDGNIIELTVREFELLKFLAQQPNQIFTRENLLEKVWGYEYYGDVRTVDVTVRRLREKVEDDPGNARYVLTKRGIGYYFDRK